MQKWKQRKRSTSAQPHAAGLQNYHHLLPFLLVMLNNSVVNFRHFIAPPSESHSRYVSIGLRATYTTAIRFGSYSRSPNCHCFNYVQSNFIFFPSWKNETNPTSFQTHYISATAGIFNLHYPSCFEGQI